MASATLVKRMDPMPVIMPSAESRATARAGQRNPLRMDKALPRSRNRKSRNTALPEKMPRQNSMVIRSAWISRVKIPAEDQASAAAATSQRPRRCWLCAVPVMPCWP